MFCSAAVVAYNISLWQNIILVQVYILNIVCVYFPNRSFLARNDIGIILINQFIAEMIRHAIDAHMQSIPAVLEIPSKEHPYDASKDSILRRAKGMFSAEDFR